MMLSMLMHRTLPLCMPCYPCSSGSSSSAEVGEHEETVVYAQAIVASAFHSNVIWSWFYIQFWSKYNHRKQWNRMVDVVCLYIAHTVNYSQFNVHANFTLQAAKLQAVKWTIWNILFFSKQTYVFDIPAMQLPVNIFRMYPNNSDLIYLGSMLTLILFKLDQVEQVRYPYCHNVWLKLCWWNFALWQWNILLY